MFWDFISLRPETTHQVSFLFSDRGIPDGHRHMNGYGSHTFKLVNKEGQTVYCKFHYKVCDCLRPSPSLSLCPSLPPSFPQTDQSIKCLSVDRANHLSGSDPDYSLKDLYEAIAKGDFVGGLLS